jgi:hypothetical protein
MLKRFGRIAVAAAATLVLFAGTHARADDVSDIKKSGKAFVEAVSAGDADGARKYALTDQDSDKFLDIMAEMSKSRKKLVDAAVAKFGDDGGKIVTGLGTMRGASQIIHDIDNAKIDVEGDTATVNSSGSGRPVKFKKVGGTWKLDLTALSDFSKINQQAPMMHKISESYDQSAEEITKGKYSTLDEAKAGVRQNMMAAVRGSIPGGR